jgi:dihydrodipicolinate synthase/N-acetylneuraminate lyase
MLYHNPLLFRTRLPVDAVLKLLDHDNIVGLKDSHRDPRSIIELTERAGPRLRVFVASSQYVVFSDFGVAGTWSYECWMDPWPVTELRDAIRAGDRPRAIRLTRLMTVPYEGPQPPDVRWRETAAKLSLRAAGYCDPGPMRFPYAEIPADVLERANAKARAWTSIRDRLGAVAEEE